MHMRSTRNKKKHYKTGIHVKWEATIEIATTVTVGLPITVAITIVVIIGVMIEDFRTSNCHEYQCSFTNIKCHLATGLTWVIAD